MTRRSSFISALAITLVVTASACGQSPGGTDDPDAKPTNMGGLELAFDSLPNVPGDAGGSFDARINTASFHLRNLRAIGDAAPGDDRTRIAALTIGWSNENQPSNVAFADAPLGLYSQISTEIVEYSITGTVKVLETVYPFEINDTPPTPVSAIRQLTGVRVTASEVSIVTLEIRIEALVKDFDWASIPPNGDGVIIIDDDSPGIDDVRDELDDLLEDDD